MAVRLLLLFVLLVALPLLGLAAAGRPIAPYLDFPPLTRDVEHPGFSWPVFLGLAVFLLATIGPLAAQLFKAGRAGTARLDTARPFPWWGWLGLLWLAAAWLLAWTRVPWFTELQPFTFTPLWLGYIVLINALTFRRVGSCLLTDRPGSLLRLFPVSALFWWFFEYLNRFAQNWYYVGVETFTAGEYVFHATIAFSTVLPAVLSTDEWLRTFPSLKAACVDLPGVRVPSPRALGFTVLLLSGAGLMGLGIWPQYLFPLLWVSPLLVITGAQAVAGRPTIFSPLRRGDWSAVLIPALAGLQCGFFWELWNSQSLAHWEYRVPFVYGFLVFEMPLLGYAGYLPFGLECKVIADLVEAPQEKTIGAEGTGCP
ncbi:hypothetical protein [Candidatus Nitrospira bockiana]